LTKPVFFAYNERRNAVKKRVTKGAAAERKRHRLKALSAGGFGEVHFGADG